MYELKLIQVFANAQTILFDLNNEVVLLNNEVVLSFM